MAYRSQDSQGEIELECACDQKSVSDLTYTIPDVYVNCPVWVVLSYLVLLVCSVNK